MSSSTFVLLNAHLWILQESSVFVYKDTRKGGPSAGAFVIVRFKLQPRQSSPRGPLCAPRGGKGSAKPAPPSDELGTTLLSAIGATEPLTGGH